MARPWAMPPSLKKLRAEIDKKWPKRDRRSDGGIGDAAHQLRKSDHNPDLTSPYFIHAYDFDVDGIDEKWLVKVLIGDARTQYVIWNRTIWSRTYGFKARRYTGSNPHTTHVHVSIRHTDAAESSTKRWLPVKVKPAVKKFTPKAGQKPGDRRSVGSRKLEYGCCGSDVAFVQRFLGGVTEDGCYGEKTVDRVKMWQRMRDQQATGVLPVSQQKTMKGSLGA